MPQPATTIEGELRSEKLTLSVTPTEIEALRFIRRIHGDKYDGDSTVVRDYSLTDAVEFHRRTKAELKVG